MPSSSTKISLSRLHVGSVVEGRYEIVRELGQGGMGTVYEATQIKLNKRVALKVLQHNRAYRDDDGNSQKRFLREARVASAIRHRNVVDIIDFGDLEDGSTYYVMELLQGRDLVSILREEGPLPWSRVQPLLRQVLAALGAAHRQGVIHRDIKPANVMLLDEPDEWGHAWVKVLDFGIARVQEADSDTQSLTGTSELLGTAAYMGPELAKGERADARTDLYAVGVVAYQLLTGTVPFRAPNAFQVLLRHMTDPPKPPREIVPSIPVEVEAFILRALEKEPSQRFVSADHMAEALDAIGGGADESTAGVSQRGPSTAPPIDASDEATAIMDAAMQARQMTERYVGPAPVPTSGPLHAGGEPGSSERIAVEPTEPTRRNPWPLVLFGIFTVAVAVLAWALAAGSKDDGDTSDLTTPTPAAEVDEPEDEPLAGTTTEADLLAASTSGGEQGTSWGTGRRAPGRPMTRAPGRASGRAPGTPAIPTPWEDRRQASAAPPSAYGRRRRAGCDGPCVGDVGRWVRARW